MKLHPVETIVWYFKENIRVKNIIQSCVSMVVNSKQTYKQTYVKYAPDKMF